MALTRQQFAEHWNKIRPGLGDNDSPLWEAEYDLDQPCEWFINTAPIEPHSELKTADYPWGHKAHFWSWCDQNLQGCVRCYSCDITGMSEWWGFTDEQDISWFILKWA